MQIAVAKGAMPPPPPKPSVRITVADPPAAFTNRTVAASWRSRITAVACDAAVVGTIGLVVYAVMGSLWAPLCMALVGYYGGGILLLGNTPGVCFVAATEHADQRHLEEGSSEAV